MNVTPNLRSSCRETSDKDGKITALHVLEHFAGYTQQYLPRIKTGKTHSEAEASLVKEIADQEQVEAGCLNHRHFQGRSIVELCKKNNGGCIYHRVAMRRDAATIFSDRQLHGSSVTRPLRSALIR